MKYVFSLLMIAGFMCSCGSKKEDAKAKGKDKTNAPVVVDVIIAAAQNISNTLEANGSIVASESLELHPEISGRITYLNIPEGKKIAKGTVLARINDADIKAQISKIKVQLDLANITIQRYKKLIDIGGLNQSDYDAALNQINSYHADINVLQAELTKTVLRAPFSGVIGLRQTSSGAYVTPSSIIATMQQVSTLKVDFTVPEEYSNLIKKGSYVAVETNADSKQKQRALIIATEQQVNTSTRSLLVRATLEGGGSFVNPGTFVKVFIDGSGDKTTIMVPANAIIPEDLNKTLVTVKGGKAVYVNVETGVRQTSNVAITSGIKPGDSIVVSGVLFTKPNGPVKVRSVKKLEEISQ